jgi:hypothetical protein
MCSKFFHLNFYIPTEMPKRDVTLTDKTALLDKIKNQLPSTSQRQLAEITRVPKSTIQQQEKLRDDGHYARDNRERPKNGNVKVRIQMLKRPSNKWFSIVTGRAISGPMLKIKSEELPKWPGHNDFKATIVGCLDGNAGLA